MALNSKYIIAPALQQHFTDKTTGDFLRNGYVLFSKDNARTIGKPVYKLTGAPPNYNYIQTGYFDTNGMWRVDLNLQGAFDDLIYLYPYDENGDVELYFVQVFSSDASVFPLPGDFQFSVQAFPGAIAGTGGDGATIINYIPNGQFRSHTDLLADPPYAVNEVRAPITNIAYGNWTFERPNSSTSKDFVQFERFGSFINNPPSNPRYGARFSCVAPDSGDTFKDIAVEFTDVNKFASTDPAKQFTFSFSAQSNSGGSFPVSFILYKNYGTGGSAPTETSIQNFVIGSSYNQYSATFSFGDNSGKAIGNLNDDYLKLILRLPVDVIFDGTFTDFLLTDGAVTAPVFPDTPDSEFKYTSIAGFMPFPAFDGSDVYLPLRLTTTGLEFDRSEIGKIYAATYTTPKIGELICDGSQYETIQKSSDGIPYSRLQSVLWDSNVLFPKYGTGANYVSSLQSTSNTATIMLQTNKLGAVVAPADGTPATTFNFFNVFTSSVTYYCEALYLGQDQLYIWNNNAGSVNAPTANTSGFTVNFAKAGTSSLRAIVSVTTVAATGLAGKYFRFSTYNSGNLNWYMWFTVDGVGSDPAPGGTGIKVELKSTYNAQDVARAVVYAANSFQSNAITTVAGSIVPVGSYWTFNTTTQEFYVWYKVNGVGTDPQPANKIAIKVEISTSDAADQVALKTIAAINSKYFAVPDFRGLFLRGLDQGRGIDPWNNPPIRGSTNGVIYGDDLGTIEFDDNQSHAHTYTFQGGGGGFDSGANNLPDATQPNTPTSYEGGKESRPINAAVLYVIKY